MGTQFTRRRQTKQKTQHNTVYVGQHYAQTNTNNVDKTGVLLQTTGGKDDPNIVSNQMIYTLCNFLSEDSITTYSIVKCYTFCISVYTMYGIYFHVP